MSFHYSLNDARSELSFTEEHLYARVQLVQNSQSVSFSMSFERMISCENIYSVE